MVLKVNPIMYDNSRGKNVKLNVIIFQFAIESFYPEHLHYEII